MLGKKLLIKLPKYLTVVDIDEAIESIKTEKYIAIILPEECIEEVED